MSNKKNQPNSSIISIIFEICFFIGFALLLFFILFNNKNVVMWNESDLDRILSEERIKNAIYRYKGNIVTVDGNALDKTGCEYSFSVNIDAHRFNKGFITKNGEQHESYYSYFLTSINKTKQEASDKKIAFKKDAYFLNPDLQEKSTLSTILAAASLLFLQFMFQLLMYVAIFLLLSMLFKKKGFFTGSRITSFFEEIKKGNKDYLTFNDIAGYEAEKKEVIAVIEYLKNPKKFNSAGAKMPRGILLFGPPGVGKTMLAKAVAGEAKVPFYPVSCTEFLDELFSIAAKRIRELFKKASENAPSIIFIDEIDMAGKKDNFHSNNEVINQFLVEMDGFKKNAGVIVFAATNRKDMIDKSLLRSGRFDKHIEMPLPILKDREDIFKKIAQNKNIGEDVDFKRFARLTSGCSGADIENIMNEATISVVLKKEDKITTKILEEAMEKLFVGLSNYNKNEQEMKIVAFHESGHAFVAAKLSPTNIVEKVTVLNRGHAGGYTIIVPENEKKLFTRSELLNNIAISFGGRCSEEVFFSEISNGASQDIKKATDIAYTMVRELGMSSLSPMNYRQKNNFLYDNFASSSDQTNFKVDQEVEKIIEEAYSKAKTLIVKNKAKVEKLANALLEKETLYADEITKIVNDKKEHGGAEGATIKKNVENR
ncbi:MAG: AAA family ATPase [Bacilli bacterium]|nr:AAA family ATPase [Bacilli bacterium]